MPPRILKPLNPKAFDFWHARHLLNRAGFGGTQSQIAALASMGLDDAVDYLVDYEGIETEVVTSDRFDHDIMKPATVEQRREAQRARREGDEAALSEIRRLRQMRQRADRRQMALIQEWWLKRMIESPRPLEEKMTLFWHGHFATGYRSIEDSYHMFIQNQLFRSHATGSFRKLTHAIIRDPAMIRYLNNNQNRRQAPNENLARELMELFTLGEGHDYTEHDIKEGARALTGYTFNDDEFIFRRRQHDAGDKRILGRTGDWDGDDFVELILSRTIVSEYLCLKLYRFFVNDLPGTPDKAARTYILALAKQFRKDDYELRPLLKTIFRSEFFYSDANVHGMIKSPLQLIVQAIRSLHVPTRSLRDLLKAGDLMGQNLFQPPSVKGWDGGASWINTSTLFIRQNVMIYLLTGHHPENMPWETNLSSYQALPLVDHLRDEEGKLDPDAVIAYLLQFNLGPNPHPERTRVLREFVEDQGGHITNAMLVGLLSLITAMPEYQLT